MPEARLPSPRPGLRLAIVLSHPTQYYSPWFRWLAAHTELEFRVFYLWDFGVEARVDPRFQTKVRWDVDLLSGYDAEFVPNVSRTPGAEDFRGFDNPELIPRLTAWKPTAILLFGYAWLSHVRLIRWAGGGGRRIPLILRGDSHLLGRRRPGGLRRLLLKRLLRRFDAFACVGIANRAFYEALGVPAPRLFSVPHAVDGSLFDRSRLEYRDAAHQLRLRLGLTPNTRVVLFAGKFTPAKQPAELLEAFLALNPDQAALVFVGDGPERGRLNVLATRARPGTVHILPFANQSEMPARYRLADIFALPSRGPYETWGLAVNEAMQLGRPCLVSDCVGCQPDLVIEGETGWVFHADDPVDLRRKLAEALKADLSAYRPRVAARIAGYSYATATRGLLDALASLPEPGAPRH